MNKLKPHNYTPRQKQVLKGMFEKPWFWCDPMNLTRTLKITYMALVKAGAIRSTANKKFMLTAHGEAIVRSFRK
jgi:hypothetical protein